MFPSATLQVMSSKEVAVRAPQDLEQWGERKLDNAIQKGHAAVGTHMANFERAAILTGVLLRERKRRLGSRKWAPWIEEHFDGSLDTADRYLKMAEIKVPILRIGAEDDPVEATDEDTGEEIEAEVIDEEPRRVEAAIIFDARDGGLFATASRIKADLKALIMQRPKADELKELQQDLEEIQLLVQQAIETLERG